MTSDHVHTHAQEEKQAYVRAKGTEGKDLLTHGRQVRQIRNEMLVRSPTRCASDPQRDARQILNDMRVESETRCASDLKRDEFQISNEMSVRSQTK
eukprot:6189827-Pleurochrysis_carterae.AAC.1